MTRRKFSDHVELKPLLYGPIGRFPEIRRRDMKRLGIRVLKIKPKYGRVRREFISKEDAERLIAISE
jgi:hypothetical protein